MRAILKAGTKVLTTAGKIFQVGERRGPSLWVRASDISGVANNAPLSIWRDISGNNNNFVQATATDQPLFKLNQVNGHAAVEMDGVNDWMQCISAVKGGTVFIVARSRANLERDVISGSTNTNYWVSTSGTWFRGSSDIPNTFGHGTIIANGNKVFINGGAALTAAQATKSTLWTLISLDNVDHSKFVNEIGCKNAAKPYFNGSYAELLVFDYRMTELDRKAEQARLLAYYNI
jgi:hypothetical protein